MKCNSSVASLEGGQGGYLPQSDFKNIQIVGEKHKTKFINFEGTY